MKKKIINIVKYLAFLGLGVFLFYLATLDITRGVISIEGASSSFVVGSGLEECDMNEKKVIFTFIPRSNAKAPITFEILDTKGYKFMEGTAEYDEKSKSIQSAMCIPEGEHMVFVGAFETEGGNIAIEGVNRTEELLNDMSKASWPGIIASFIMGYLAILIRGVRWLILLEPLGYKPKVWNSIHAVAFAYFANTFVPRSGEIARCGALNQTDDIPVDKLFGTVISERIIDSFMLLIFMSLAVFSNLDAFYQMIESASGGEADGKSTLLMYAGIALGATVLIFAVFRKKILSSIIYIRIMTFMKGVFEGLKSVLKMRRKVGFIIYTILIWGMYFLMAFVIFKSIEATAEMSIFEALFVMVAGGFGMVLPSPGGIGSYHWLVKLAFVAIGMSAALGFAVANVIWLTQTAMIVLGGGIGYIALMITQFRMNKAKDNV